MIQIVFKPQTLELTITGHSDYGKKGEDVVCAAVSTLFYTLHTALTYSIDMLKEEPVFRDEEGNGYIGCKPKEEYEGNIARSYWTILTGMEVVAENYPECVTFTVEKNF